LKDLYRPRMLAMLDALEKHLQGVRYTKPDGGFFLSLFLPPEVDGAKVRDNCRDFGIILSDGRLFFPDQGAGDDFIRLPFCGFPLDEIDEGVKRLAQAINHYRK
jgi:DNA-binding transcriptional MocR family regulator